MGVNAAVGQREDELRERMVRTLEQQLHPKPDTLAAFRRVPRHLFLPEVELERVYSGSAIPTHYDDRGAPTSSSSEPAIMAVMLDALGLERGQRVLEVGAGTGYNAAILAELVGASNVVTVDIDAAICREARLHLAVAGYADVAVEAADGWAGWASRAPYDRIELTASTPDISPAWVDQLDEHGMLAAPLLLRPNAQAIVAFRKRGRALESAMVTAGGFMPLRGLGAAGSLFVQAGPWRVASSAPIDPDRVVSLLSGVPRLEVLSDVSWYDLALFAIADPRSINVSPAEGRSVYYGLMTPDGGGIAFLDTLGLLAPRHVLMSFGSQTAADELRAAVAAVHAAGWRGLRVTAVPAGSPAPGEAVFAREHYTFVVEISS
jgi:protein-L-isoaspartate(D-aspartate) O-methyltransferase